MDGTMVTVSEAFVKKEVWGTKLRINFILPKFIVMSIK